MMPKLAGLIGFPVAHSKSPRLHNAAFAHFGIDARYELWETPADGLAARVEMLRQPQMLGANVTLPHKVAVLPLLDRLDPMAEVIGAVNTIVREADGSLTGVNTDAPAFLAALRHDAHFEPQGKHVVVLGASGAARAAVAALLDARVAAITVVNRTLERAEELLGDALATAAYDPELVALAADDRQLAAYLEQTDLLVNATSLGWHENETPLVAEHIPQQALVYDMVYHQTRLLHEAAERGARTHHGLSMLIRQAGLAFERWTGHKPPLDVMQQALL